MLEDDDVECKIKYVVWGERVAEGERKLLLVTHNCKHVEGEFVWPVVGVERRQARGRRLG